MIHIPARNPFAEIMAVRSFSDIKEWYAYWLIRRRVTAVSFLLTVMSFAFSVSYPWPEGSILMLLSVLLFTFFYGVFLFSFSGHAIYFGKALVERDTKIIKQKGLTLSVSIAVIYITVLLWTLL